MSTSNQTLKVNPTYWHNKRYSKDEIKRIQSALNKQALGKQIAVDGIFGKETLAAIKNFQTQHSDILKVDGLVGDKTLSALGITGLADSSLPQTRPGQNQSRGSEKKPKGMSDADYEYQKNYYTSPEMISYLTNTTNAITDPEYINHYYNALNFVSPEIASRLRVINNEGDAYDEDVVANRNQASARRIGIQQFKHAVASGHIKTAEQMDKWMTDHNLSKEEMQELMNDPSSSEAMLRAGVIADNGRVNSQKSQAARFAKDVADAESRAGIGITNMLSAPEELLFGTLKDIKENGASALKPSTWLYNRLNNTILGGYTGGEPTYLTGLTGSTGNEMADYFIDAAFSPRSWFGFGASRGNLSSAPKRTYHRVGHTKGTLRSQPKTYYQGYLEVNPFNPEVGTITQKTVNKPATYWRETVAPGDLKSWSMNFDYVNGFNGYKIPSTHGEFFQYPQYTPIQMDVPDYDRNTTYGPYIGINRVKSNKEGGLINKVQYFKNGNTMQQQDIKQKVKDLVQLAMQQGPEAEQANQLIQSILQKAKQGDPQSVQIAQLIQDELQQAQGQTAYAKFGSKLDYIRSLKYARGGKACPACEAKQQMITQQACGGKAKKAKKRYFGGWL